MRTLGLGAIAAAAMVLAGCDLHTYDVIEIRDTEASGGTAFTQALHQEYRQLASTRRMSNTTGSTPTNGPKKA